MTALAIAAAVLGLLALSVAWRRTRACLSRRLEAMKQEVIDRAVGDVARDPDLRNVVCSLVVNEIVRATAREMKEHVRSQILTAVQEYVRSVDLKEAAREAAFDMAVQLLRAVNVCGDSLRDLIVKELRDARTAARAERLALPNGSKP